jgi:hypothetical protein
MDQLVAALGLGPAPKLDLGSGETATLTNPFPAAMLNGICKGEIPLVSQKVVAGLCRYSAGDHVSADDPASLASSRPLGFPVSILLKYTPTCGTPAQEKYGTPLTTVFTVFLPTDETVPPNQNPTVGAIYANPTLKGSNPVKSVDAGEVPDASTSEPADAAPSDDGGAAYDGGASYDGGSVPEAGGQPGASGPLPAGTHELDTVIFPRQKRVGLWLDVPMSSIELVPRPSVLDVVKDDPPSNIFDVYYIERLTIAWYAEDGDFGGEHGSGGGHTGFNPPINATSLTSTDEDTLEQTGRENLIAMSLHEDYKPNIARIIVVVRDSRGGVTWTSGAITMEDRP